MLLVCLLLTGCTTPQITTTLQAVVDAVGIATPIILNAAGVPAATSTLVTAYLGAVDTAVAETGTELASSDSSAVKADKIVQYFTQAGLQLGPNLPAGTPTLVVQLVNEVAQAVQGFLTQFGTPQAKALVAKSTGAKVKIEVDKKALAGILTKNASNMVLLKK
jgi:hypothetical protein